MAQLIPHYKYNYKYNVNLANPVFLYNIPKLKDNYFFHKVCNKKNY